MKKVVMGAAALFAFSPAASMAQDMEASFCEEWTATCGDWMADTTCADWWAAAAEGTEGDSTGATKACYWYHLDVAKGMTEQGMIDVHCAHAMGAADVDGNAPCNGSV